MDRTKTPKRRSAPAARTGAGKPATVKTEAVEAKAGQTETGKSETGKTVTGKSPAKAAAAKAAPAAAAPVAAAQPAKPGAAPRSPSGARTRTTSGTAPLSRAPEQPVQPKARAKTPQRRSAKRNAMREAKFAVGQVVRHRVYPFRGVVFDIDPVFNNTDEWWLSIPEEIRPRKDQPFYHLLAENEETEYIAYVSEQNLLPDQTGVPVRHPQVAEMFAEDGSGRYRALFLQAH